MGTSSGTEMLHTIPPKFLRVAVVVLAIVALTGSLATRTFHGTVDQNQRFESGASQATRQHLDRDAVSWFAPVVRSVFFDLPTFYPRVAPAGPPVRALLLEENLYNRPPPSC